MARDDGFDMQERAQNQKVRGADSDEEGQDLSDNVYAAARDKGHRIDPRAQVVFVLGVVLVIVYLVGLVVPRGIFDASLHASGDSAGYTVAWFIRDLQDNVNALVSVLMGQDASSPVPVLMIRFVVVALTGSAMALCGCVYQGAFRNALVTPSTLGVMSGASLGMAIWVAFFFVDAGGSWFSDIPQDGASGLGSYLASSYGLALCSFAGCVTVVGLVLLAVKLTGNAGTSGIMMIITGQVIGAVMGSVMGTMRYYYVTVDPDGARAQMLMQLQISSFYRTFTVIDILAVGVPLLVTFLVVMRYRQQLMLLSFSEAEARAMGVETRRLRFIVIGLCTVLTAIVVSFCGHVGFVGFLVPHMARRLVGPNYRYLFPAAVMLGAVFVLGAYMAVSVLLGTAYETMAGMFVSIAGAAVFLVTALRGKGGERGRF